MKKVFTVLAFVVLIAGILAYMILFDGKFDHFEKWWDHQTRDSAKFLLVPIRNIARIQLIYILRKLTPFSLPIVIYFGKALGQSPSQNYLQNINLFVSLSL